MTKNEHFEKAKELIEKNFDKGKSYIRGSLSVKDDGPLSEKLKGLLNGNIKKTKKKATRKKKRTTQTQKSRDLGKTTKPKKKS